MNDGQWFVIAYIVATIAVATICWRMNFMDDHQDDVMVGILWPIVLLLTVACFFMWLFKWRKENARFNASLSKLTARQAKEGDKT